jgi:molybdenum cofactor cytidylyltransferase
MRVAFTGAGGKSSALAVLARESHGAQPIVLTTTTRLGATQRSMADQHIILRSVEEARRLPLGAESCFLVTGPEDEAESKLLGLAEPVLSEVARRCTEAGALMVIEADGARGRWVKAPAEHEPVIPEWVDLVVPIAGLPAVGFPLNEETAHRPERIAALLEMKESDVLTPRLLAELLSSPRAGLKGVPGGAEVRVLLTGAPQAAAETMRELRERILTTDRFRAVIAAI